MLKSILFLDRIFNYILYISLCVFNPVTKFVVRYILQKYVDIKVGDTTENDIQVFDDRFYAKILVFGTKGFGDSYIDNWWMSKNIEEIFRKLAVSNLRKYYFLTYWFENFLKSLYRDYFCNRSSEIKLIQESYDDLTDKIHDNAEIKSVSCDYYRDTDDPVQASKNKLDLITRKIKIQPGMKILDIGCGYGSQLKYIAEKYKNVECVGVNISRDQVEKAKIMCQGLPIEFKLCDFMEIEGKFDRIICVEMMFHLGKKRLKQLLKKVNDCLEEDGLFFVHAIQRTDSCMPYIDQWVDENLYKGHYIPLISDFLVWTGEYFNLEDVQSLGMHMAKTMLEWSKEAENLSKTWIGNNDCDINEEDNEEARRQIKMMVYGHKMVTGVFLSRKSELYHYVFSKRDSDFIYYGER